VLLAFVLTVVAHPLVGVLTRHRWPHGLAVAAVVLAVDGGLIAFTLAVVVSVGQLATILPQYATEWQQTLDGLRSTLAGLGVGREQVAEMVGGLGQGPVLDAIGGLLRATVGGLSALVLVLITALFMAVDGAGMPARLAAVPRVSPGLRTAMHEFASGTRRYILVSTVFGFAVAVVDTVALALMGIPLPLLWGLLSFLTNYVPNIGFVLGLIPPTLLGLLVGGPKLALLVVVVYCVANFLIQSVLQPVVVGDAVGLAVTLTFLSTILWTAVIGPLGAVLAIPLTLLVQAVLVAQDPERRWARVLLAGKAGAADAAAGARGTSSLRRFAGRPAAPDSGGRSLRRPARAPARSAVAAGRSRPWHPPRQRGAEAPSANGSPSVPS
jgi:predicted PurR-regulated permease PerM